MEVEKPTVNGIHEQGQIYMESMTTNSIGEVVSKKPQKLIPPQMGVRAEQLLARITN